MLSNSFFYEPEMERHESPDGYGHPHPKLGIRTAFNSATQQNQPSGRVKRSRKE
jgi:hypothetical protein